MSSSTFTQAEKAKQLYDLHHSGKLLMLPNIWDALGALLLEELGYKAIATASAAVAYSNGYNDGEQIPFADVLRILKHISTSVNIPVTADIESGYATEETALAKNIKQLVQTGIVGINIEDTDKKTKGLLPSDVQCARIKLIKKIAMEMNVPLFINARTDTFIHNQSFDSAKHQLDETITRGNAYKAAGADCFYPILVQRQDHIQTIVEQVQLPVNVLMMPGIPDLHTLVEIGVARVSLGPGYLKYAVRAMRDLAVKLQSLEGLQEVTENDITSDYFKRLVLK